MRTSTTPNGRVNGKRSSPFPAIGDYGFLADCATTALVAPSGNVEWLCLPHPDSPSVFGALLDRDAGKFHLGPAEVEVPVSRRYIPGTLVLETSWWVPGGWLVVLDALLVGPWHHQQERSATHRRTPTDYDADHILLRTVRCVNGQARVRLDCAPAFDYGRRPARWEHISTGYHEAVAQGDASAPQLQLTTDLNVGLEGPSATARTVLHEGEERFVALSWSENLVPQTCAEAKTQLNLTVRHWRDWLGRGHFPDHPWRSYLQRAALTLKGLTFAPTGGYVAAATTSLPETPGGERNWDYRYTWVRDATLALWSLDTLGFDQEADDFFYFIADLAEADGDALEIMYAVDGQHTREEYTLEHLAGYDGARPVRAGNAAHAQNQHDLWGAVVSLIYLRMRSRHWLDQRLWSIVVTQVEQALTHWCEPDHGPWEVRGHPRHFTVSKVACWLAAHLGARIAEVRGHLELVDRWQAAADEIRNDILIKAVDTRGVFTQHYDTTALDASVLIIPFIGFLPYDDPRVRRTVLAIADELTEEELVLRYRSEETDDGFTDPEGTFTICSFGLVSALALIGEVERARQLCEKLLLYANPLQLYAEQIDPRTKRQLGNFPQAFTHLALIHAVMHIIRAEKASHSALSGSFTTSSPVTESNGETIVSSSGSVLLPRASDQAPGDHACVPT